MSYIISASLDLNDPRIIIIYNITMITWLPTNFSHLYNYEVYNVKTRNNFKITNKFIRKHRHIEAFYDCYEAIVRIFGSVPDSFY